MPHARRPARHRGCPKGQASNVVVQKSTQLVSPRVPHAVERPVIAVRTLRYHPSSEWVQPQSVACSPPELPNMRHPARTKFTLDQLPDLLHMRTTIRLRCSVAARLSRRTTLRAARRTCSCTWKLVWATASLRRWMRRSGSGWTGTCSEAEGVLWVLTGPASDTGAAMVGLLIMRTSPARMSCAVRTLADILSHSRAMSQRSDHRLLP